MTKYIRYEDIESYVEARDRVVQAAMDLVELWEGPSDPPAEMRAGSDLCQVVNALRSLHADRGVRDPSPPGEQETGAEQAHREDRHD